MTRISTFIRRLAAWLNTSDGPVDSSEPRDWFDLPVYHPASDRDR